MEFMTSKPGLQRILEGKLGSEKENHIQEVTGNKLELSAITLNIDGLSSPTT